MALSAFAKTSCPVCAGHQVHYSFSCGEARVLQCAECGFTFRSGASLPTTPAEFKLLEHFGSAEAIVRQLLPSPTSNHITVVTSDERPPSSNWHADSTILAPGLFDSASPLSALQSLRDRLTEGQNIVFTLADIRHTGAPFGSQDWERRIGERNAYLDTTTTLTVLYRAGFRPQGTQRLSRRVSLEELQSNPHGDLVVGTWMRRLVRCLPAPMRRTLHLNAKTDKVAILARKRPSNVPVVSVVVPVYNEAATAAKLLDKVLQVELSQGEIEVIIVESNSTDGSRAIVQRYEPHPRVRCFYEDRPRGKGHATRHGLEQARGDIILIQDADLEYDIEDYHSLLAPILAGHETFMLGSRHGGRKHWKLRQFGKPAIASFYNFAHVLVTSYINLLFGLRLRDPQTMFKVYRRDCLENVKLQGNYFDLDYELLLKIVRRGYYPTEVPVNYRSRSHAEGKKIRMWRDAPLGLWMITRLRLTPLRRFLLIGGRID